jgi:hypothetical protein
MDGPINNLFIYNARKKNPSISPHWPVFVLYNIFSWLTPYANDFAFQRKALGSQGYTAERAKN